MKKTSPEYKPQEIEKKWQGVWDKEGVYRPNLDTAKRPFYNLMMFPYPSAEGMHVGNMYAFTGSDIYGRYKRMQGYDVFEPMGLDGFGIHSENYAIKVGKHPKEQAERSEKNFYRQLKATGNAFDWSRTVETYNPDYYKWTQWIFIELFKAGLAYRKKAPVNFCPSCKTVLADEQVIDGACERCSSVVEKRDLEQWFFKITSYAERLLNNLEKLDWTEKVKIAQKNWIGKKEGTTIRFKIKDLRLKNKEIEVFTTRGDTLYGATFLALAPEHPISALIEKKEVKEYIQKTKKKSEQERTAEDKEKTGIFSGLYAINPLNNEEIPVWIADYALMGFGTGALFGDAHDERDVAFAKKYGIPLKATLITDDKKRDARILKLEECFTGDGVLVNSGEFSGLTSKEARVKVVEWLDKNKAGGRKITYHLRDWLISRQRYWGPPIPMIYCETCKWQPVPQAQLPVLLPEVEDWRPQGSGTSPLANHPEFYKTTCPNCGGDAKRETDVSDTFLDSAWYFFRYIGTEFDTIPFPSEGVVKSQINTNDQNSKIGNWKLEIGNSAQRAGKWLPVHMYIGGAEHSVLHLLYSRFLTMVFKDLKLISHFEEPFTRFYAHGLLIKEGAKMSKSKGNVIIPDEYIKKYGADTLRTYLMFLGPYSAGGDFYDSGIEGMHKFLRRVWLLVQEVSSIKYQVSRKNKNDNLERLMHKTIKAVTNDIENLHYNTAIAHMMEYYNELHAFYTKYNILDTKYCKTLVLLLAPFAPHMTEELYQNDKRLNSIHLHPWPAYDPTFLEESEVTIVVQVNGRVRDILRIENSELRIQSKVEQKAKKSANVQKHLKDKKIVKVIYVKGKIINFVVA